MNDYGLSSYTGEVDTAMNISDSPSQTGKATLLRNFLVQVLGTYKWDKGKGMSQVYRNRSPSRVQGQALENKLKDRSSPKISLESSAVVRLCRRAPRSAASTLLHSPSVFSSYEFASSLSNLIIFSILRCLLIHNCNSCIVLCPS